MEKIIGSVLAIAVIASLALPAPSQVEARDMAAIRACGGPATSYNQCLHVCGCMGGQVCYKSCGTKDFSKAARMMGGGKKKQKRKRKQE